MATDKKKETPKAGAKKKLTALEIATAQFDKEQKERKEREAAQREKVEKEQAGKPQYVVASGKAITTRAGLKKAGEPITAKMLHRGQAQIVQLLEMKAIEEAKR
jgi:hypothetical protein